MVRHAPLVGTGSAWARLRMVGARSMLATGRRTCFTRGGAIQVALGTFITSGQVDRLVVREDLPLLDPVLAVELAVVGDVDEHRAARAAPSA